jgi:serine phosphatase RsbU (regulator of sigma subunit)
MTTYASIGGWQWQYTTCTLSALGAMTLAILVRDLIRDRAEKQRLAAELAASRAVQQVLIPDRIPLIPGFTVQSVYRPFGDVGGDFFQILPLSEGGALVVIGDVSGKGMPAAMTVSLVVGALSLAVETTTKPGEILAALNRALCGRNRDGFTTCLVIRADADGTLTIANAGHLAPYIDGQELQLDNGLPLGLAAEAAYPQASFKLSRGQHILVLTDGVIEARNKTGKLFGFEGTAAIAKQSAESIAHAAQEFGQEDDITVLTLHRVVHA